MSEQPEYRVVPRGAPLVSVFKRFWHILAILLISGGLFSYWWAFHAFSDQYYAPLQPIPYSHKLHAGELGIDCQYCHFNARRGKHAGVPPISICLGCHDPAMGAAGLDFPGVQKLLELVTENGAVRPAYADSEDLDYQSDGSMKIGGGLHWNRVHKLPDHVYFTHEWHVKAGVACQTCHGQIEEMTVVAQHAPMTMGWCIECHRDNNYVGGPDYDGSDASFTVGTANYDILRARIQPDLVVDFPTRSLLGSAPHDAYGDDAHGKALEDSHQHQAPAGALAHAADIQRPLHGSVDLPIQLREMRGIHSLNEGLDDDLYNRAYFSQIQSAVLRRRQAANDALGEDGVPRWRVPDLPSLHAAFYHDFVDSKGQPLDLRPDETERPEEVRRWLKKHIRRFDSYQNAPTQCSTCHQ